MNRRIHIKLWQPGTADVFFRRRWYFYHAATRLPGPQKNYNQGLSVTFSHYLGGEPFRFPYRLLLTETDAFELLYHFITEKKLPPRL